MQVYFHHAIMNFLPISFQHSFNFKKCYKGVTVGFHAFYKQWKSCINTSKLIITMMTVSGEKQSWNANKGDKTVSCFHLSRPAVNEKKNCAKLYHYGFSSRQVWWNWNKQVYEHLIGKFRLKQDNLKMNDIFSSLIKLGLGNVKRKEKLCIA